MNEKKEFTTNFERLQFLLQNSISVEKAIDEYLKEGNLDDI